MFALVRVDAPWHFDVALSALFMVALVGGLVAFVVEARVRASQAAALGRRAREAASNAGTLAEGDGVVAGAVELGEEESVAVRVYVEQEGTEAESSGTWSTTWTETDRRVSMRPFYLVQGSEERVRVEPKGRAFLVDAMDGMILVNRTSRTRYAELSPGERIFAVGRLSKEIDPDRPGGGYREAPKGWVMRPPRRGDLLLSSEPLEQRYERRARTHRKVSYVAALTVAIACAMFSPYLARVFAGRTVECAVLEKKEIQTTDEDGHLHTDYALLVRSPSGGGLTLDIGDGEFGAVIEGGTVLVRYVPSWEAASELGSGPTAHMALMFALSLLGGMAGIRYAIRRAGLAWYERRVVDHLGGKLDENASGTSM